jgi:hypothetical protein
LFSGLDAGLLGIASALVSPVIVHVMARDLAIKSAEGTRASGEVLGFREFLERVDEDRLQRASPQQLERCLPYAIALGVERPWTKQFAGISEEWPNWLDSGVAGQSDATQRAPSVAALIREVESVFSSYSRASKGGPPGAHLELETRNSKALKL